MESFKLEPTKEAGWYALISEAQALCGYQFDDDINHYLIITLDHFTSNQSLSDNIIAIDFLDAVELNGQISGTKLRAVGDQCLLLSGLFPENALKKNVNLNYFVQIGKQSYHLIAYRGFSQQYDSELFQNLSDNFVGLMDTLSTVRKLNNFT